MTGLMDFEDFISFDDFNHEILGADKLLTLCLFFLNDDEGAGGGD